MSVGTRSIPSYLKNLFNHPLVCSCFSHSPSPLLSFSLTPSSLCSFFLVLLLPRRYLDRRQYAAQCSFWDEILGNVTAALKVNGYKTYYIMVNMIWYMVY